MPPAEAMATDPASIELRDKIRRETDPGGDGGY
jgi:hypothetical protein